MNHRQHNYNMSHANSEVWATRSLILASTSGLAVPYLQSHYWSSNIAVSPFRVLGIYHLARLLPPIIQKLRGKTTDRKFLLAMSVHEMAARLFFAPWLLAKALKAIWPYRCSFMVALVSTIAVFRALPYQDASENFTIKAKLLFWLNHRHQAWSTPIDSVRGIFMMIYESWTYSSYHRNIACLRRNRVSHLEFIESYKYRSLESERHIRLLRLCKQKSPTVPRCELLHFDINTTPPYKALSYTWGRKAPSIPLVVGDKHLLITSAVEEFLTYEWSTFTSKLFWIDAICIDQANNSEKETQIPLMTEIYQSAALVIVWLAPPEKSENSGFIRGAVLDSALSRSVMYMTEPNTLSAMTTPDSPFHREVGMLLCHPWFTRTWIIQEIAVASDVHVLYKGTRFSYADIAQLLRAAVSNPGQKLRIQQSFVFSLRDNHTEENATAAKASVMLERAQTCTDRLDWIRETYRDGLGLTYPLLLQYTLLFQSKDPRDKIFALYGLLDSETASNNQPDYTKSAQQLSHDVAGYILQSSDWFEILRLAAQFYSGRKNTPVRCPSWVLDLGSDLALDTVQATREVPETAFKNRDKAAKPLKTDDPNVIQIQCSVLGTVRDVGPVWTAEKIHTLVNGMNKPFDLIPSSSESLIEDVHDDIKRWYSESKDIALSLSSVHDQLDEDTASHLFWQVWSSHLTDTPEGYPSTTLNPRSLMAQKLFEFFTFEVDKLPPEVRNSEDYLPNQQFGVTALEFFEVYYFLLLELFTRFAGNRLCTVSPGYLAIVPRCVESGDVITHVRGGYMPVALRKTCEIERRAELVGMCYVHGIDDVYGGHDWAEWLLE